MVLPGFWMDVGQPKDFIAGATLFLKHKRNVQPETLAEGECIRGPVLKVCAYRGRDERERW